MEENLYKIAKITVGKKVLKGLKTVTGIYKEPSTAEQFIRKALSGAKKLEVSDIFAGAAAGVAAKGIHTGFKAARTAQVIPKGQLTMAGMPMRPGRAKLIAQALKKEAPETLAAAGAGAVIKAGPKGIRKFKLGWGEEAAKLSRERAMAFLLPIVGAGTLGGLIASIGTES